MGATEILAGLVPGEPELVRLAGLIGRSRAKELVFSGRFVGAEETLELGLVDELVAPDGVYDAALAWACRFAEVPSAAVAVAKAAIDGRCGPGESVAAYVELLGEVQRRSGDDAASFRLG